MGHGPEGSVEIDTVVGSWQGEIFYYYKIALHRAYAEDVVAWEDEERIRQGKPIYTPEQHEERVAWFLSRMPYKLVKCRYHSFPEVFPLAEATGMGESDRGGRKVFGPGKRGGITLRSWVDTI
jgi:hypothetical protein